MIRYRENTSGIIQSIEIELAEIPDHTRQEIESKISEFDPKHKIFQFEAGNKLVYKTEVLIPKINKNRLNVLMVLGNPAVRSVVHGMFFSYERIRSTEGKERWREHRFWRALRDCGILEFFDKGLNNPTPENIQEINDNKKTCLLNGSYKSCFNLFLLPYFSFPTPASGNYNGVNGIKRMVGKEILEKMKECEFKRFKGIVSSHDIRNVICFEKTHVKKEIIQKTEGKQIGSMLNYPVYKIDIASKQATLYSSAPTRRLHIPESKEILKRIVADIKAKNKIDWPSPNVEFKRGKAPL